MAFKSSDDSKTYAIGALNTFLSCRKINGFLKNSSQFSISKQKVNFESQEL